MFLKESSTANDEKFSGLSSIKIMLGEWALRAKIIHVVFTTSSTLNDETRTIICEMYHEAIEEYNNFVRHMAPVESNHTLAIVIRAAFKSYFHLISRAKMGQTNSMIVPPPYLYHGTTSIVADIPHYLTTRMLFEQLRTQTPHKRPRPRSEDDDDDDSLLSFSVIGRNPVLGRFIDDVCCLASYPVLPPSITGTLVPTMHSNREYQELKLLEPGADCRSLIDINELTQPRPCVLCKIHNLIIGLTDTIEQARRTTCDCVMRSSTTHNTAIVEAEGSQPFLEALITTRASMNTRLNSLEQGGCDCKQHQELNSHAVTNFIKKTIYYMTINT
jgi:hypothetical protein